MNSQVFYCHTCNTTFAHPLTILLPADITYWRCIAAPPFSATSAALLTMGIMPREPTTN